MSRSLDNPPSEWAGARQVGDSTVYVNLGATPAETIVWHWCPVNGRWDGARIGLHAIVQREPLTITASLYRPDCCGWHGFITNGQWIPA
jgi:hypothetical protein